MYRTFLCVSQIYWEFIYMKRRSEIRNFESNFLQFHLNYFLSDNFGYITCITCPTRLSKLLFHYNRKFARNFQVSSVWPWVLMIFLKLFRLAERRDYNNNILWIIYTRNGNNLQQRDCYRNEPLNFFLYQIPLSIHSIYTSKTGNLLFTLLYVP